jgi:predicted ATP-dependent serine protease
MHKSDISNRHLLCDGCKHEKGRWFGKCTHCSRNPDSVKDYYEKETMEERIYGTNQNIEKS